MRRIFTDDALQPGFLESGYVTVPMLSGQEISGLLDAIAELRPDDGFVPRESHTLHLSFLDTNLDYRHRAYELIRSVFDRHVKTVLHGYRMLNGNFFIKQPGARPFALHQHWPPSACLDDTTVTIWCPLGDVGCDNGTLQFVVGSHKLLPHIEAANVAAFFRDFHDAVIEKHMTPIPLKAGEAVIFDDSLIHWSGRNMTDRPRIAAQMLCIPTDVQPVYQFWDPAHPDRFELIEADTEFWITCDAKQLAIRKPNWKSLGFVPNRNHYPTEREFVDLLRRGNDIRRRVYERAP